MIKDMFGGVYEKSAVGLFNEDIVYGEDVLFNIAVGRKEKKCIILRNKLYYYRNNPNSVTSKLWCTTQQAEYSLLLAKQLYKLLVDETNPEMRRILIRKFRKAKNAVFGELYASEDYEQFNTSEVDKLRVNRILLKSMPLPIKEKIWYYIMIYFPFLDTFSFYKLYRKFKN